MYIAEHLWTLNFLGFEGFNSIQNVRVRLYSKRISLAVYLRVPAKQKQMIPDLLILKMYMGMQMCNSKLVMGFNPITDVNKFP